MTRYLIEADVQATYWFAVESDSRAEAATKSRQFDPHDLDTQWTRRMYPTVLVTDIVEDDEGPP